MCCAGELCCITPNLVLQLLIKALLLLCSPQDANGLLRTRTNRSGGIQGGISNGENIVLRIAFKPTSTVTQSQRTVNRAGQETELRARGRHDPCVVPRAVPMVEAMAALVLVDHLLQQVAQCNLLGAGAGPGPGGHTEWEVERSELSCKG